MLNKIETTNQQKRETKLDQRWNENLGFRVEKGTYEREKSEAARV